MSEENHLGYIIGYYKYFPSKGSNEEKGKIKILNYVDCVGDDEDVDDDKGLNYYRKNKDIINIKVNGKTITENEIIAEEGEVMEVKLYFLKPTKSIAYIFNNNPYIISVNLSNFGEEIEDINYAFQNCINLERIDGLDCNKIKYYKKCFVGCEKLNAENNFPELAYEVYDHENNEDISDDDISILEGKNNEGPGTIVVEYERKDKKKINIVSYDFYKKNKNNMQFIIKEKTITNTNICIFSEKEKKKIVRIKFKKVPKNLEGMFEYIDELTKIIYIDLGNSKIINLSNMCSQCRKLIDIIGLKYLKVENVINFTGMFECCYELQDISPLREWNPQNVKDISGMFLNCRNINDKSPMKTFLDHGVSPEDYNQAFYCNEDQEEEEDIENMRITIVCNYRKDYLL